MSLEVVDIKTHDDSQDITIPGKLIDDDKVYIKKVGNVIHLIPYHNAWQSMIDATNDFPEDFMESRDQPTDQQQRESFDE